MKSKVTTMVKKEERVSEESTEEITEAAELDDLFDGLESTSA